VNIFKLFFLMIDTAKNIFQGVVRTCMKDSFSFLPKERVVLLLFANNMLNLLKVSSNIYFMFPLDYVQYMHNIFDYCTIFLLLLSLDLLATVISDQNNKEPLNLYYNCWFNKSSYSHWGDKRGNQ